MNYVDAYVTKVHNGYDYKYNKYWVRVDYQSEGIDGETKLMFDTIEEATSVEVGHHFLT